MSTAHSIYQVPLELSTRPVAVPEAPSRSRPRTDVVALRASLDETMARKVGTAAELRRKHNLQQRNHLPTMIECFDRLLGGGLEHGKLVELNGRRSTGRFAIVMSALAAATQIGEAAALVDCSDALDPRLAAASGVDLSRLLWIRPATIKHAVMSAEMLITTGFPLVILDFGLRLRGRRPDEAAWVRLARSAERHAAVLFVSAPFPLTGLAADATISATRSRVIWSGRGAAPKLLTEIASTLTLEKQRGSRPGAHESLAVTSVEKPRQKRKSSPGSPSINNNSDLSR